MPEPPTSSPSLRPSVLVVGAGPVGLVAACELARQGVMPRLIDALPEPTAQYRAVGVQPRSQEMLAALGALDRIRALALPQTAVEIDVAGRDGFDVLLRNELTAVPTQFPMILNLPQTETEAGLRERAAELGVRIERGVELTAMTMDDTGVDVELSTTAGTGRGRVDWVIGADGGHSAVRTLSGSRLEGGFHGSHFIVADTFLEADFDRQTTRLFASSGGLTVVMCMLRNRTRLMFQIDNPGPHAPAPTLADVQRLARERMGAGVRVYDPESISCYSIHHAQVPQYRVNRAFLAGDAAHIHSPAGGQGMNTGMQDAANLAWKLALVCRGLADPALLDSYHDERHPVGAAVVRQTTLTANAMTLSGPPAHLRDLALRAVDHLEPLRDAMAEAITEVAVSYPHSPLNATAGTRPHGAPAPGTHASDVRGLTDAGGAELHVGDLQQRPGFLLLALTDDAKLLDELRQVLGDLGSVVSVVSDAATAPAGAVVDTQHAIADEYGIGRDGLALLRPDGYFAYLSTATDPAALRTYLGTRLGVRTSVGEQVSTA